MKRYRFPLASVLRIRTIELDRAAAEVGAAQHAVTEARRLADERRAAYAALSTPTALLAVADFREHNNRQHLAADAVVTAENAVDAATEQLRVVLDRWTVARQKVRVLESLDERTRAEHALEAQREDQLVLDDLVTSRRPGVDA